MNATTDTSAAHFGPIGGGADRDARYEAAVNQVHQRFDRRRADLMRARQLEEAALADLDRLFVEVWGASDGDRRRIDNRLRFEHVVVPAHQHARVRHLNAITTVNADLEQLPRQEAAAVARIGANLIDGPAVHVPDLVLPSIEDDTVLRELHAQQAAATSSRQALYGERDALYGFVEHADRELATLAEKVKYGLSTKADHAVARKAAGDAQARHHRAITAIADLTTELDGLERRIAERTVVVERERDHAIARELEEALFATADALVPAMTLMTRLRRASMLTDSDVWVMKALNLDDPRSVGRAFLQQAMEAGWVPSTNKE